MQVLQQNQMTPIHALYTFHKAKNLVIGGIVPKAL